MLIIFILNVFYPQFNFFSQKAVLKAGFSVDSKNSNEIEVVESNTNIDTKAKKIEETEEKGNWYLEIPVIYLKANIQEGTTKEVLDKYIGHFEESKTWVGNVCLAAHNRGYEKNYFSQAKELKEGDNINYFYQDEKREYLVIQNEIIQATDVSCLENTEENTLTLITCVENEPNYRRCIRAIEKKP